MFNRILKPILQSSKLNREKFVKNKKVFVENLLKNQQNHNKISTRKMHTFSKDSIFTGYGGNGNGGNGNGPNNLIYMFILLSGVFISSKFERKNKV
jgi:hypothetical protein